MAKVTITLEDGEEDGAVCVDLDFGEEVDLEANGTAAQHAAMEMVQTFQASQNVSNMELYPYDDE